MMPTKIHAPPAAATDFVSLEEYQSTTPESFTDGRPVLHAHVASAHAVMAPEHCDRLDVFDVKAQSEKLSSWAVKHEEEHQEVMAHEELDVFITSKSFILFNTRLSTGLSIPYNVISIHGLRNIRPDKQAVWMQLDIGNADDEDYQPIELTLMEPEAGEGSEPQPDAPKAAAMFKAISDCSDLNPDPKGVNSDDDDDDDRIVIEGAAGLEAIEGFEGAWYGVADGELPPPLPGSGGWITAENVDQFFDEDGTWKGRGGDEGDEEEEEEEEEEGEGEGERSDGLTPDEALRGTRDRDQMERDGEKGGEGSENPESKRPRVA